MDPDSWRTILVVALAFNAATGFGYRVFRLTKGGPVGDVIGQAVLAVLLTLLALFSATAASWPRWAALIYALLFGVAVMPVWVLAVLLPARPGAIDYAFTACYWAGLAAIAISAIAAG